MKSEHKPIYISVEVNFLIGIMLGIILFFGQVKSVGEETETILKYNYEATLSDFFRLTWMNVTWMISIFFARIILPIKFFHPIITLRGAVSSFSALYLLNAFGIKEMLVSLFPQCLSILPLLSYFSALTTIKYRENIQSGCEPCSLRRSEIAWALVLSIVSGAIEVLVFAFFCKYLF